MRCDPPPGCHQNVDFVCSRCIASTVNAECLRKVDGDICKDSIAGPMIGVSSVVDALELVAQFTALMDARFIFRIELVCSVERRELECAPVGRQDC
jgi:hypothetical protein